jgi:hypothetical protein
MPKDARVKTFSMWTDKYKFVIAAAVYCAVCSLQMNLAKDSAAKDKISTAKPCNFRALSSEKIEHGKIQLRNMLRDRPRMATCVSVGDPVWNWTVSQFAGKELGCKIYWESHQPDIPAPGANHYPVGKLPGSIRIANYDIDGSALDGETQWVTAVYELHNIRNGPGFKKAYELAQRGLITKHEWVELNTRLEFNSLLATKNFFLTVWAPNARNNRFPATEWYWGVFLPSTYESWKTHISAKPYLRYWANAYPSRRRQKSIRQQAILMPLQLAICQDQLQSDFTRLEFKATANTTS